jgi:hypothetical protein
MNRIHACRCDIGSTADRLFSLLEYVRVDSAYAFENGRERVYVSCADDVSPTAILRAYTHWLIDKNDNPIHTIKEFARMVNDVEVAKTITFLDSIRAKWPYHE